MNLLEIDDLHVKYNLRKKVGSGTDIVKAVNGVDLEIRKGEILAIAGESGCGKSTLAKAVMKLVEVESGEIVFDDKNIVYLKDKHDLKNFYNNVQMIFQNPYSSLNPKMKIGQILSEPLEINTNYSKKEILEIVEQKLVDVGLDRSVMKLYPHEFSGGQRQRIAIARALMMSPQLIIADEPVSALDVSIQAQIINLIKSLNENFNITFLFISHDLSVIRFISDRIAVMYLGEIIELGQTEEIFATPKHPYTKALLSSVPSFNVEVENEKIQLKGELPSAQNLPAGCKFHTRCPHATEKCEQEVPQITNFSDSHYCKCFLYEN